MIILFVFFINNYFIYKDMSWLDYFWVKKLEGLEKGIMLEDRVFLNEVCWF